MGDSPSVIVRAGSKITKVYRRRNVQVLPDDLLIEMLLRLPVKSLLRFKSVCKKWYKLITSPYFISMHNSPKNNIFISNFDDIPMDITVPPFANCIEMVACFNGVVCLSISLYPNYFLLWNPATRAFRLISPNSATGDLQKFDSEKGRRGWSGFGFSLNAVGIHFKIAEVTFSESDCARVEMFSSNTNSWVEKKINLPCRVQGSNKYTIYGTDSANWYMSWHVAHFKECFREEPEDEFILCFDMLSESFKRIEMPFHPRNGEAILGRYNDSMALSVHRITRTGDTSLDLDVWVMNDFSGTDQSWFKLMTCRPPVNSEYVVGFFCKDDATSVILTNTSDQFLYLYDPKTGEINQLCEVICLKSLIIQYSESLAPLK